MTRATNRLSEADRRIGWGHGLHRVRRPTAGPTQQQKISFQDDGSDPTFFAKSGITWRVVGKYPYDRPPSCASFTQAPGALRAIWHNCPLG